MNKIATIGQLLIACIALLISLIMSYVSIRVTDEKQDQRIMYLEAQRNELNTTIQELNNKVNVKLDMIQNTQTLILIELQNKQDRPK